LIICITIILSRVGRGFFLELPEPGDDLPGFLESAGAETRPGIDMSRAHLRMIPEDSIEPVFLLLLRSLPRWGRGSAGEGSEGDLLLEKSGLELSPGRESGRAGDLV
jgi:hypothetical protein